MSSPPKSAENINPETVSEVSKLEGGPTKGSVSAELQSQLDKERNAQQVDAEVGNKLDQGSSISKDDAALAQSREQRAHGEVTPVGATAQSQADKEDNFVEAAENVGSKMADSPLKVTKEDAAHLQSRESRAIGKDSDIPSESMAADAQALASANEELESAKGSPGTTKEEQSAIDKEKNFEEALTKIKAKAANEPGAVTQEDAELLQSREHRAKGGVEKGGITSQVQALAAENEKENQNNGS